ncbi:MAG: threonine--tRNA ligase [Patescibacteria group bacterium]
MQKDNKDYLEHLRHSAAHLLAAAVMDLWPKTKRTIGPSIENGFYYDFDFGKVKISEDDLPKIENKMHYIVKSWERFERHDVTKAQIVKEFKTNEYKQELINEFSKEGQKLTVYQSSEFRDLCRGGHIDNPSQELKHFKLLSIAGAYWRGDEKNKMLTRIYGTAFASQKELDEYLHQIEEAKKRDHRKLGKELELFTINNEVGQGLTIWLPNGSTIRREIENYMVSEQIKMGYKHVYSPHIGQKSLWEKSGHWDLYREKMYSPMDVEGVEYLVKPMTCPMHIQTYEIKPRSYRELPLKIAEIASVYRYEKSGELSGLLRVRAFTQDDAHIFCTPEQATDQFIEVFNFIQKLYKVFGFENYRVRVGIRSKSEKYLGNNSSWKKAEDRVIAALKKAKSDYFVSEGDAAFYGPKADFLIKDALGREWQCGTVQVDFMLPQRFGLKYIDNDGKEKTPVMIHRAPLGSLERFLSILIENYAGAFPVWISPVQVKVLPVSDKSLDYAMDISSKLLKSCIRVEVDERAETLGAKIRDAQAQKVPYMLIVGEKEKEASKISVRTRAGKDLGQSDLSSFIKRLKDQIDKKALD